MSDHLPARSRLVHDAIRAAGIPGDIVVLPDAASTAALAAEAGLPHRAAQLLVE